MPPIDVPIPPSLDDEQMLGYQAQIGHVVHMLMTKKEDLARYEKQTAALLERAPRAASRNRRQKLVDENDALIQHHRQVVQATKEQLASLMRELQEKRERAAAERGGQTSKEGQVPKMNLPGRYCQRFHDTSFRTKCDVNIRKDLYYIILSSG